MTSNVGNTDRWIRMLLGVGLFSLFFLLPGTLRWLGLIGLVPLATAFGRFCPLYTVVGVNTKEK